MRPRTAARTGGRLALAVLLLAACNAGDDDGGGSSAPTTTSPAVTTSTASASCDLTPAPPAEGQVTFTLDGKLLALAPKEGAEVRCLADDGVTATPQWNGSGDRVFFDAEGLTLSRPTGTSVLRIDDQGRLYKRPVDGVQWKDISFLTKHEHVLYHPAGRHIVSVGTGRDDAIHGIYIADNSGQKPKRIVEGEGAIRDLTWTVSGALAFTAQHDGASHLHRLQFPDLTLTTVAEKPDPTRITDVAASRFEGGGLAWSEGGCTLRVNRDNKVVAVPPSVATTTPIGWLPDGVLIVQQRSLCAGTARGPVYAFRPATNTVDLLTNKADAVAIRAELPIGPAFEELPDDIESQAPA